MSKSYRDLKVWQKAYALAKDVYLLSSKLPKSEIYGLASQMQRAAVSVPSNIAEGQQRNGKNEFKQFLHIARDSAAELATQLQLSGEVYDIDAAPLLDRVDEIQRMLYALLQKL